MRNGMKANVQFIKTDAGDLAVLPRKEYEALLEAAEGTGAVRVATRSLKAIASGREVVLPKAVVDRITKGENPVRVLREWREIIQGELAVMVGVSQNYISMIESGERKGRAELLGKIARALGVPVDVLIE